MLTGTGTAYVNATFSDVESIPEEDRPKRTPYSVCEIPEQLTPSAKMISAAPKEMVAKAGSFDDFSVSVMNDGNMAIAAFDLGLYLVSDSGDEELVETAHMDALDPTKNAITMADGTVVQSGESACYRKEDFDNTSRKHDWVLDHEALTYKIHVADGKATGQTLVLSAATGWGGSFNNLFLYENGRTIVYSVTEDAVADYVRNYLVNE